jgi:hypothetical protein
MVCALGLALVLAAGCTAPDSFNFLLMQSSPKAGDRVLAASVDSVAQSLQASLTQLGMEVNATRKGDTVYVASRTTSGTKFTFVLTRLKGKESEQTRVRIEWEDGKEEEMGGQILARLALDTQN